jgi:hypothetical protein
VTYRDDHDAALARADNLEHQVHELERERDELRAKLAVAERPIAAKPQVAASRPPFALVAPLPREVTPLTTHELEDLRDTLEAGIAAANHKNRRTLVVANVLAGLTPLAYLVASTPAAVVTGVLGLISLLHYAVGRSAMDETEWRPVLDAIRDEPERVISIENAPPRLIVHTTRHSLRLRLARSALLVALLARRCRYAALK